MQSLRCRPARFRVTVPVDDLLRGYIEQNCFPATTIATLTEGPSEDITTTADQITAVASAQGITAVASSTFRRK